MREAALREEIWQALSEDYSLEPRLLEPHKKIYRLHTKSGIYALKEMKYPQKEFAFITGAMQHLQENGFDRISPFLKAKDGRLCIAAGGRFWTVCPWLDGREANYVQEEDCLVAADTLRELHTASLHHQPVNYQGRIKWGGLPQNFAGKIAQMQAWLRPATENGDVFGPIYLSILEENLLLAQKALRLLAEDDAYSKLNRAEEEASGFCHHDYAPHNLLIGKDGLGYVIDFDYCISDTCCHDLASFLQRIMRANLWQTELAELAYAAYTEKRCLPAGSGNVLAAMLLFPQNFWQIAFTYYIERNQPPERQIRRLTDWKENCAQRLPALFQMAELCRSKGDQ